MEKTKLTDWNKRLNQLQVIENRKKKAQRVLNVNEGQLDETNQNYIFSQNHSADYVKKLQSVLCEQINAMNPSAFTYYMTYIISDLQLFKYLISSVLSNAGSITSYLIFQYQVRINFYKHLHVTCSCVFDTSFVEYYSFKYNLTFLAYSNDKNYRLYVIEK